MPKPRTPIRRKTPLKRSTPLPRSTKPIPKVSEKEKARRAIYAGMRDANLAKDDSCEMKLPGCTGVAIEEHHASGRTGNKLFEDRIKCCRNCHDWCELHPEEAKARNLSKWRNTRIESN